MRRRFIIKEEDMGYIILHKSELKANIYEEYKKLPNCIVQREDTNDEHLMFRTFSVNKAIETELCLGKKDGR